MQRITHASYEGTSGLQERPPVGATEPLSSPTPRLAKYTGQQSQADFIAQKAQERLDVGAVLKPNTALKGTCCDHHYHSLATPAM